MGWVQCFWCDYWVHDPYLLDTYPAPFCDWCFRWYMAGGGPYQPDARARRTYTLNQIFRSHNIEESAIEHVARFLHPFEEP